MSSGHRQPVPVRPIAPSPAPRTQTRSSSCRREQVGRVGLERGMADGHVRRRTLWHRGSTVEGGMTQAAAG
jgi:hypothetical protein